MSRATGPWPDQNCGPTWIPSMTVLSARIALSLRWDVHVCNTGTAAILTIEPVHSASKSNGDVNSFRGQSARILLGADHPD